MAWLPFGALVIQNRCVVTEKPWLLAQGAVGFLRKNAMIPSVIHVTGLILSGNPPQANCANVASLERLPLKKPHLAPTLNENLIIGHKKTGATLKVLFPAGVAVHGFFETSAIKELFVFAQ